MGALSGDRISQDGRDRTEGRSLDPTNLKALALLVVGKRRRRNAAGPADAAPVCREGSPGAPPGPSRKEWQTPIFRSSDPDQCDLSTVP